MSTTIIKKFTNDSQQRKRSSLDLSKPVMTDQSDLKSSNINNIMDQYAKTGLLPVQQEKLARYIDNTQIMSLEDAHDLTTAAHEQFMQLPAQIRKLMDNDSTKLVSFIQDPENYDILVKYKVLIEKPKDEPIIKVEAVAPLDPPSVDS